MKFWNFTEEGDLPELSIHGEISAEEFWGNEVTPQAFLDQLGRFEGRDIKIWINSPGGDVVAASEIYTALINRKGKNVIMIDALAASAASVIAMAGEVHMSPTAILMIHNPWTIAWGSTGEMKKAIQSLEECKESLLNAYEIKCGNKKSRAEIAKLMDQETWMSSRTAIEYGFADYEIPVKQTMPEDSVKQALAGRQAVWNSIYRPQTRPEQNPPKNVGEETNATCEHANACLELEKLRYKECSK